MGIFRTKSIEQTLRDIDEPEHRLQRRLTLPQLVAFGIGIVIGTGIFTLTGTEAAENAGPAVTLSFAIAGAVSVLAALCYAELSAMVPAAGSSYTYSYATMGEIVAWAIGWDLILEFALGAAVVARSWSSYFADLVGLPPTLFAEEAPVNIGAPLIVLALGAVATLGIRESARLTSALVVVKVGICLFVVAAGLFFVKTANLTPFVPPARETEAAGGLDQPLIQAILGGAPVAFGVSGVLAAAAVVFFSYTGFEAVANLAEESKQPSRDLPRALIFTLTLAMVLYVSVAFVVTGMAHYSRLNTASPLSTAFDLVGQEWAATLISLAAVAGLTTVILVDLVTMSRISFSMSRDGLLPRSLSLVHPQWGTPYRLTAIITVVVAVVSALVPLTELAEMVAIGTLFAFVLVAIGVIVLRYRRPDLHRPFRVPLFPFLPGLAILACAWLATNLTVATWLRFLVWFALGVVIYLTYGRRRSRLLATIER